MSQNPILPTVTDSIPVKASFPSRTSLVPFVRPGGMECCQLSYSVRSTGSRIRWPWLSRQKPGPSRCGSVCCAAGSSVMAEVQSYRYSAEVPWETGGWQIVGAAKEGDYLDESC